MHVVQADSMLFADAPCQRFENDCTGSLCQIRTAESDLVVAISAPRAVACLRVRL